MSKRQTYLCVVAGLLTVIMCAEAFAQRGRRSRTRRRRSRSSSSSLPSGSDVVKTITIYKALTKDDNGSGSSSSSSSSSGSTANSNPPVVKKKPLPPILEDIDLPIDASYDARIFEDENERPCKAFAPGAIRFFMYRDDLKKEALVTYKRAFRNYPRPLECPHNVMISLSAEHVKDSTLLYRELGSRAKIYGAHVKPEWFRRKERNEAIVRGIREGLERSPTPVGNNAHGKKQLNDFLNEVGRHITKEINTAGKKEKDYPSSELVAGPNKIQNIHYGIGSKYYTDGLVLKKDRLGLLVAPVDGPHWTKPGWGFHFGAFTYCTMLKGARLKIIHLDYREGRLALKAIATYLPPMNKEWGKGYDGVWTYLENGPYRPKNTSTTYPPCPSPAYGYDVDYATSYVLLKYDDVYQILKDHNKVDKALMKASAADSLKSWNHRKKLNGHNRSHLSRQRLDRAPRMIRRYPTLPAPKRDAQKKVGKR